MYRSWSPVATYGVGGAALIVAAFTALSASAWGLPAFILGVGYVVKAGFEAFTNYAEKYAAYALGDRRETMNELERKRRKASRKVWYNRGYGILQDDAKRELRKINQEIAKRKEEMNAK